jgi:hypothetical protein
MDAVLANAAVALRKERRETREEVKEGRDCMEAWR